MFFFCSEECMASLPHHTIVLGCSAKNSKEKHMRQCLDSVPAKPFSFCV